MASRPAELRAAVVEGVEAAAAAAVFVTTMTAVEVPRVPSAPAPATTVVMVMIPAEDDIEEEDVGEDEGVEEEEDEEDGAADEGTALEVAMAMGATRALEDAGAEEVASGATEAAMLEAEDAGALEEIALLALEESKVPFARLLT